MQTSGGETCRRHPTWKTGEMQGLHNFGCCYNGLLRCEMDGTGCGLCPDLNFVTNDVEF